MLFPMKPTRLLAVAGIALGAPLAFGQPALTIYNQDFAVVRERVPLDLKAGVNPITFSGATLQLEPDSVVLRDPAGQVALRILEQSYRADTLSSGYLLALHEGRELEFLIRDQNAKEYIVKGRVIRSGYQPGGGPADSPIVEVDGKIRFSLPGEPLFTGIGEVGVVKPALYWQIAAERDAKLEAELGYITGGLNWHAAYNLVAPEKGDTIDVVGWVTISNSSGKTFDNATLKLMAGAVNKLRPEEARYRVGAKREVFAAAMMDAAVTEKAFDEFHLYSLPRPTTLRDRETKQVEFMRATGVKAQTLYVYDGAATGGRLPPGVEIRDPGYGTQGNTKVAVMREFKNTEENGLGLPLPAGRTRFYRRDDADGRLEFTGENTIDHTAKNETVRLYTGDAFDIVGERKRTDFSLNNRQDQAEEAFEIKLRNRKTTPVEVRVVEHLYRGLNWEVIDRSQEFTKTDAQTIEFRVPLQPDEEKVLTYRVRYDWK